MTSSLPWRATEGGSIIGGLDFRMDHGRTPVPRPAASPRSARAGPGRSGAPPIRVLIVDHSDLVRHGIHAVLVNEPSVAVVGEVSSAAEAIAAASRHRPDVVLMDSALPDRGGYDATCVIRQECPATAIVMLSSFEDASHALDAFASGANGYLSRDVSEAELVAAIHRAATGETSVEPVLGARLLQALAATPPSTSLPDALTPRELDVLRLLATGRTNKEIANSLIVAVGTVKVHLERIFGKLGTSNRSEAAVRAIELGIVEPTGDVVAGSRWDAHRRDDA